MVRKFCQNQPDAAVWKQTSRWSRVSAGRDPGALAVQTPHLQTRKVKHTAGSWPLLTYWNQRFLHMGLTHGHWSFYWARLAPIPKQTVPTYMRLGGQINGQPLCWHVTQMGALSSSLGGFSGGRRRGREVWWRNLSEPTNQPIGFQKPDSR